MQGKLQKEKKREFLFAMSIMYGIIFCGGVFFSNHIKHFEKNSNAFGGHIIYVNISS